MKALRYPARRSTGKNRIAATKPCDSAADLALAYTPGVTTPCRAIQRHPDAVYRYTNKGNLVAIVSNGSRPVKDLTAYADAVATRVRLSREERTDLAPAEAEAYRG
jgi:hypothetical protein